jgi:uncharacterized membrane protein
MIRVCTGYVALCVEAVAAAVISYGMIEALVGLAPVLVGRSLVGRRRMIRVRFGGWLLLGLEFELAADIVRTAIAPSWNDIGQLASIAVIRTALNYAPRSITSWRRTSRRWKTATNRRLHSPCARTCAGRRICRRCSHNGEARHQNGIDPGRSPGSTGPARGDSGCPKAWLIALWLRHQTSRQN